METLTEVFEKVNRVVWGPPLLILLVGTGIYLTMKLKLLQVFKLPLALKCVFGKDDEKNDDKAKGDISSFAALCTALSSTIGTGNIVGVATAIQFGGPGALFWMWIAAFFGMATKYAEGVLAIKYRIVDENGEMSGGPMYYIEKGLGVKWLGKIFAFFGVCVACFGIGTFAQVNAISKSTKILFNVPLVVTAIIVTVVVAIVTLGGVKRISKVTETIVPFMAIFYIVGVIFLLILNIRELPEAILLIITSAFNPKAALGGSTGITVVVAMQRGIGRGVFSNEAGLGSAPIAAAAAKTKSPVKQGLITMTGTFFDTIIICTMTGLALIVTGVWDNVALEGAELTTEAFKLGIPIAYLGKYIVNIGLIFFAFTTILGWNYYGERCIEYIFGIEGIRPYRYIYIILIAIGGFLPLNLIFVLADIVNGLMAIPNLIALIALSGIVAYETDKYFKKR
ncbi:sodium:alanine symporter family protein [Clostridium bornimense]|uniref:alanine/glycine:cation symporter family protein n=1 Tax=Clostridium bornimense TaxID=1216932 RepID=UPI001C10DD6B|nr:sodium:alanine symporter family protein [Clostridium bornimense]MBU5315303.1 sodium:alanine symporter family protein [Clostridium bornimense]